MKMKLSVAFLALLFVALIAAPIVFPNTSEASALGPSVPALEEQTVGKFVGDSGVNYIVKLDGTDALYIRTTRYGDLVPYIDGDGTPVTYEEFLQRLGLDMADGG